MTNINSLPPELVSMIFDYLDLLDEAIASKVYPRWEAISRNRLNARRYKRFYYSNTAVPLRIHRFFTLNEDWFRDHENPASDEAYRLGIRFTRGSHHKQTWLNFTFKDFNIDRYIAKIWTHERGEWRSESRYITDHWILDEKLFRKDTIAEIEERHEQGFLAHTTPNSNAWHLIPVPLIMITSLNDIICKKSKKIISKAEGRTRAELGMRDDYIIRNHEYLNMSIREFLEEIWERAKVWILSFHKDLKFKLEWPHDKVDLEIPEFPEIESASVELTYGKNQDMVVMLRVVRAGKRTYKDGCSECYLRQKPYEAHPYKLPHTETRHFSPFRTDGYPTYLDDLITESEYSSDSDSD
ncbi:hypothetical protein TWF481_009829 [Arthrobotrys musiformis]|uniref:F-box domain-containing protein n=1 Tax=Arthrobotrys musiformis TaxID=47236 RepID=A0AAV9W4Z1_9PEZI